MSVAMDAPRSSSLRCPTCRRPVTGLVPYGGGYICEACRDAALDYEKRHAGHDRRTAVPCPQCRAKVYELVHTQRGPRCRACAALGELLAGDHDDASTGPEEGILDGFPVVTALGPCPQCGYKVRELVATPSGRLCRCCYLRAAMRGVRWTDNVRPVPEDIRRGVLEAFSIIDGQPVACPDAIPERLLRELKRSTPRCYEYDVQWLRPYGLVMLFLLGRHRSIGKIVRLTGFPRDDVEEAPRSLRKHFSVTIRELRARCDMEPDSDRLPGRIKEYLAEHRLPKGGAK